MNEEELVHILALHHVPRIGDITAKKLITTCGSAKAVFTEKGDNLLKIEGIGALIIEGLLDSTHLKAATEELKFINEQRINVIYFQEEEYPVLLKHCIDSPLLLFQVGQIDFCNRPVISIVGTRNVTSYGVTFCENLIAQLTPYDPIIVSGFAYGIDITAHKSAIKHGLQTVGCLAHGLNQIYPKAHKRYMSQVERNGGFLTDFWSTDTFDRNNFLKRNRIIAGISQATIVIESAEKGGSLVTADIANSYNRDVFAVPGRANDLQSVGCNNLIKTQQAHLLSHPLDIPYILNWKLEQFENNSHQKKHFEDLNEDEIRVFNYLKTHSKQVMDVIALECQIPSYRLAGILLNMELKALVRPLPGKQFELI